MVAAEAIWVELEVTRIWRPCPFKLPNSKGKSTTDLMTNQLGVTSLANSLRKEQLTKHLSLKFQE